MKISSSFFVVPCIFATISAPALEDVEIIQDIKSVSISRHQTDFGT